MIICLTIDIYIYTLRKENQTQIQTFTSFKQKIKTALKSHVFFMTAKA